MANNFSKFSFTASGYQSIDPITKILVPGASAVEIITLDLTPVKRATITIAVTVAALTGLEVWVRGDQNGEWMQLSLDQIYAYGRNDAGINPSNTPANVSCFVSVEGWSDVQLRAKSAGAASLFITAGGK